MSDDETTPETAAEVEPEAGAEVEPEATAGVEAEPVESSEATPDAARRRVGAPAVIAVLLVVGLLASGALAAWLFFTQYRPDRETDDAVRTSAVNAARDGTVALLSYKPDSLKQDFDAAKSHLSGDFLTYYDQFTKQVITPAAESKGVTTTAQVVGAAATQLHPSSAVVLVFINQVTTSKERPDPSMASSSVLVSMTKVNGSWLISKFDPV